MVLGGSITSAAAEGVVLPSSQLLAVLGRLETTAAAAPLQLVASSDAGMLVLGTLASAGPLSLDRAGRLFTDVPSMIRTTGSGLLSIHSTTGPANLNGTIEAGAGGGGFGSVIGLDTRDLDVSFSGAVVGAASSDNNAARTIDVSAVKVVPGGTYRLAIDNMIASWKAPTTATTASQIAAGLVADITARFGATLTATANGAVYDTWSLAYEANGRDEDGSFGVDQAFDGQDNNTNNLIDDPAEFETRPPYPYPLRGIEVRIRCYEPESRQVRQVTIRHTFVPH